MKTYTLFWNILNTESYHVYMRFMDCCPKIYLPSAEIDEFLKIVGHTTDYHRSYIATGGMQFMSDLFHDLEPDLEPMTSEYQKNLSLPNAF